MFAYVALLLVQLFSNANSFSPHCVSVASNNCPNENITFWLYHRESQDNPLKLDVFNLETITPVLFNKNPMKILIHGYSDSRDVGINAVVRPALFKRMDYNVIVLDYGMIAPAPCYTESVGNTYAVANCTAQLINHLVRKAQIPLDRIHLIGHSLGAHISGLISNYLTVGTLRRITGLDPAAPLFSIPLLINSGLQKDHAKFVDVMHTNGLQRGKFVVIGHVDFYVNGGLSQPGCENNTSTSSCSHQMALKFYAESVNTKVGFWGKKYGSLVGFMLRRPQTVVEYEIMGEFTPETARGIYAVITSSSPPYALGKPESEG